MPDPNYLATVYGKQGAGEIVIASGGQLTQEPGGIKNWQAGGLFYISGRASAYYSEHFGSMLDTSFLISVIKNSVGVFSVISLASTPMHYFFMGTTACSNASLQLPSANTLGGAIYIDVKPAASVTSLVVYASNGGTAGVSVITALGSAVSQINMCTGTNGDQNPFLLLICNAVGAWSVADYGYGTTVAVI